MLFRSLQRAQEARRSPSRPVSPAMAGKCFKCFQKGHYRRACTNKQVCFRCGEEGHGSGGCKRPRSPDSEDELRQQAMQAVERRLQLAAAGRTGGAQPGGRGQGAPAACQPGAPDRRTPAAHPSPTRMAWRPREVGLSSESTREPVPEVERAHVAMSRPDPEPTPVCIIRRSAQLEDMEQRLKFEIGRAHV